MCAYVGVDTSCYTTSVACVDECGIVSDLRTVLSVKQGERGLRQSDGLFQHIRNLERLVPEMFEKLDVGAVRGVCVSARPRPNEDSYMPVFLAGKACAASMAAALRVPLLAASHQEGHVRAALYGNEFLMGQPFLGMHISGGTTEVFLVDEAFHITLLSGTEDLHAGQFVDRIGVAMGLRFPCGKQLEALAGMAELLRAHGVRIAIGRSEEVFRPIFLWYGKISGTNSFAAIIVQKDAEPEMAPNRALVPMLVTSSAPGILPRMAMTKSTRRLAMPP